MDFVRGEHEEANTRRAKINKSVISLRFDRLLFSEPEIVSATEG